MKFTVSAQIFKTILAKFCKVESLHASSGRVRTIAAIPVVIPEADTDAVRMITNMTKVLRLNNC